MSSGVQDAVGTRENFIDQFDLAESFNVFLRNKRAQPPAVGLEPAFGCRV